MREIKGSTGAKIAAWAAVSVSGIVFLAGIAGLLVLIELGVYETPKQERRTELFESVAGQYSVMALSNLQLKNDGNSIFSDEIRNFRYGIIKAESLDGKDFNRDSTYIERNFTENVREEDLYKIFYEIGPDTEFQYSGTLFGRYSVYDSNLTYEEEKEISAVCYDSEKGIFYYEASDEIYPVRHVIVEMETEEAGGRMCEFEYDPGRRQYQNMTKYVWENEQETESEGVHGILGREYLTFDLFDGTGASRETWHYCLLDGIEYYGMEEIMESEIGNRKIAEETGYTRDENRLLVTRTREKEKETYWVVSILPEKVEKSGDADLFVQADRWIERGYGLRYGIFFIILLSFAVTFGLVVFLISAAGHRRGTEEIVKSWVDRIPLEIYLSVLVLAEVFVGYVVLLALRRIDFLLNLVIVGWIVVMGILCMCWMALLSVLTFAVRIKTGTLFRNTVIFRMFRGAVRLLAVFAENLSLFWKAEAVYFGIVVLEGFFLLIGLSGRAVGILFLIAEKIILVFPIFLSLLQMQKLKEGAEMLAEGDLSYRIETERMFWEFRRHGDNLNSISQGMSRAVDERMKSERFKTELITNVSHDIKTPLTSIINYVDLLGKEDLQNEAAQEYLEVLERQSGRLKKLIEDLMEASKASTGNLDVHLEKLEAGVSMVQIIGEFEEKTRQSGLELLIRNPEEPVYILADSRHFWRVIDNLMNNICKYAQPSTRVYINLEEIEGAVTLTFRNTSRYALNISGEELMERFVRGDSSRNTEGSGLGLSIAQSLMELMGGSLELYVDGDLFKVTLKFQVSEQ